MLIAEITLQWWRMHVHQYVLHFVCPSILWLSKLLLTLVFVTSLHLNDFCFYKICLSSISFFPITTMSSAYANTFSCSLPIFIPLGTSFMLCITFCNAKLTNIGDRESPCFNPAFFFKKIYVFFKFDMLAPPPSPPPWLGATPPSLIYRHTFTDFVSLFW